MPELNPKYLEFQKELEAMLQEILDRLNRGGFTDVELAQLSAEIDFLEELRNLGFDELVDKYFANYDDVLEGILKEAKAKGVDFAGINIEGLAVVKELDKEYLLGHASRWAAEFESEFIKSIIRGDSVSQTIKNLNEIPLTDAQLGTVLNTAYSDLSRTATVEVYKDKPEQRFKYVGGVIPTSSEQCRWLMQNQDPKGYTMDEIRAGIETPFGIIDESGRVPNYNCIHEWVPI